MEHLAGISPLQSPNLWMFINSLMLLWSFLLVIEIIYSVSNLSRLDGARAYLVWNFTTTIFWVLEVGLSIFDLQESNFVSAYTIIFHHFIYLQTYQDVEYFVEFLIAIYYLFDSMKVFCEWYKPNSDLQGQLPDAIINCITYLYQVVKLGSSRFSHSNYEEIDDYENQDIMTHTSTGSSMVVQFLHD